MERGDDLSGLLDKLIVVAMFAVLAIAAIGHAAAATPRPMETAAPIACGAVIPLAAEAARAVVRFSPGSSKIV